MKPRGQSTLEWVIGAAVILGTIATQRDHPSNHGAQFRVRSRGPVAPLIRPMRESASPVGLRRVVGTAREFQHCDHHRR